MSPATAYDRCTCIWGTHRSAWVLVVADPTCHANATHGRRLGLCTTCEANPRHHGLEKCDDCLMDAAGG